MTYTLNAHMPGLIARVEVKPGDKVEAGQEMVVINCMKTEMSCVAAKPGTVKEVLVKEWDEMEMDAPMVVIEEEA